ncbi:hypothetical protein E2562_028610 [Oryza meyeriana var. granulata]|uniref:DUF834 domain-containing protein n=1 Tax=Oryza meyeriana var. granulata TaxID=110450 RepID=A0A6G1D7W7_9ORYZ|nr:hypothetical protein E2562_028610 [Oryza meyeriana var. granulata]
MTTTAVAALGSSLAVGRQERTRKKRGISHGGSEISQTEPMMEGEREEAGKDDDHGGREER